MSNALPEGRVTFLFTDIEGSTRLFQRLEDRYQQLLDIHHELIRAALARHHGHEVRTIGDAFFAAFDNAHDGVAGAVHAQRLLTEYAWPADGCIRVRMGLHTGSARAVGDDYIALAVHQAARVEAAAHGGQILLSAATAADVTARRSPDFELAARGRFRLKDFDEPQALFQVRASGLLADFPPLRATDADHARVALPRNTFVGRVADLELLASDVERNPLVTLLGPGGIGKTRLAGEFAARADLGQDAAWFVELAASTDPSQVDAAVAHALEIDLEIPDLRAALVEFLADRYALVVLDNCEHLLDACANLIEDLLTRCPRLHVLVTSREPLHVVGERVIRLQPLALPVGTTVELDELMAVDAVRLFVERAQSVQRNFVLTEANAASIIAICRRLDGLPLAIELAAARTNALSPEEIAHHLADRLDLLRNDARGQAPRRQTLEALLNWSHDLLTVPEQILFRRLASFRGGFTIVAAEDVCTDAAITPRVVLDLVCSLVDRSLVEHTVADGETRYRLLETIRTYARDKLIDAGEDHALATRHQEWCITVVGARPETDVAWWARVEPETENVTFAITNGPVDRPEVALRLACEYWARQGRHSPVVRASEAMHHALARYPEPVPERSAAQFETAIIELDRGHESLAQQLLDDGWAGLAGITHPEPTLVALAYLASGLAALHTPDLDRAADCFAHGLATGAQGRVVARIANGQGLCSVLRGDYDAAQRDFAEALRLTRAEGAFTAEGIVLGNLAEVAARRGDDRSSRRYERESLELKLQTGPTDTLVYSLIGIGELAGREGRSADAVELLAAGTRMLTTTKQVLFEDDRVVMERTVDGLRALLAPDDFASAWARGTALSDEDAAAVAWKYVS